MVQLAYKKDETWVAISVDAFRRAVDVCGVSDISEIMAEWEAYAVKMGHNQAYSRIGSIKVGADFESRMIKLTLKLGCPKDKAGGLAAKIVPQLRRRVGCEKWDRMVQFKDGVQASPPDQESRSKKGVG
jgi:hypothetical protein